MRPHCPWFNDDILQAKRTRRSAERSLRAKNTVEHLIRFKHSKNRLNKLVENAKKDYYENAISDKIRDPKAIFKLFNKLVGKRQSSQDPKAKNDKQVADDFVIFFKEKIEKITSQFGASQFSEAIPKNPVAFQKKCSNLSSSAKTKFKNTFSNRPVRRVL